MCEPGTFMSAQYAFSAFSSGLLLGPMCAFFGGSNSLVVRSCLIATAGGCLAQGLLFSGYGPVLKMSLLAQKTVFMASKFFLSAIQ